MHLLDEFPEFGQIAFDGELYTYIYDGGKADFVNIDVKIPLRINSDGGGLFIRDSRLFWDKIIFINRAYGEINNSIFDSSDTIMLLGTSTLSVKDSFITTGALKRQSLFNIFKGSHVKFINSDINSTFSDFALVLYGSSLFATSTRISGMHSYGIQASYGSIVSLYDVSMDTILSPVSSSAFIMLIGSRADIKKSKFSNTTSNAIELYQSNERGSDMLLDDSLIEDFGQSGISVVRANLLVKNSTIRRGAIGIENIFATTTISNSNISENLQYGISAHAPAVTVHAENNFWGDKLGPYHVISNQSGLGNTVSDNIFFTPWLSADPRDVCCSNVLFLPGLEASRLYKTKDQGEKRLWEPTIGGNLVSQLFMNNTGESINPDIYTRDVLDEALIPIIGLNIYKSFIAMMDGLKKEGIINDWEPLAYDWRLSFDQILKNGKKTENNILYTKATSSPYIIQELKRLVNNSKTGKVTLIAHSNGGLLAKALMIKLSEIGLADFIDKIIFIAVPQVGTPQTIGALLHGFGQSIPLILSAKTAMELSINMPSAYNLLPSASYFDFVSDPVIKMRENGTAIASSTLLHDFLIEKKLNSLLLENAKVTHKSLDTWLPSSDTELIQIAGWGIDTVSGIEYYKGIKRGKSVIQYKPIIVLDGDSTVVAPSALSISTSTPNIKSYWLDLNAYNKTPFFGKKHSNILEVEDLRDFLKNILKKENQTLPAYLSTTTPVSATNNKKLHFVLHSSSLGLNIYDNQGNHTGISTTTGSLEEKIPNAYYQEFGQVKYISVPISPPAEHHDSPPSLHVIISKSYEHYISNSETAHNDDSFTLEIDETIGNDISTTTSFIDIAANEKTLAKIDIILESISDMPPLKVDENDDGLVDFEVKPGEVFISAEVVLENQKIISNETNNSMKTIYEKYEKIEPEIIVSNKQSGQSRHSTIQSFGTTTVYKTSIRDIQELIDSIKLPDSVNVTFDTNHQKQAENLVKKTDTNIQTAAVFNSSSNMRSTLYSIMSIIIAILKAIWIWILRLFSL